MIDHTGEAASAASPSSQSPASPGRARGRQRVALIGAVAALLAGVAGLAVQSPAYHEWRVSHQSLPALLRERGRHPQDPVVLYYIGRRLDQQGRFSEADGNLRNAVGLDPDSPRYRDEWARALL